MNPRNLPCNSPRRTPGGPKKFVVRACKGGESKVIRYGDSKMSIKKSNPARRKSFRARHGCDSNPPAKTSARYWSCRNW
jgi:hypothetical protein